MKRCPNCQNVFPPAQEFCPHDGVRLPASPAPRRKRSVLRWLLGGVAVFALLGLGGCGLLAVFTARQPAADPAREKQLAETNRAAVVQLNKKFADMRQGFPDGARLQQLRCGGAEMDAVLDASRGQLLRADYDDLARFGPQAAKPEPNAVAWDWLTSEELRELKPAGEFKESFSSWRVGKLVRELQSEPKYRYVAVFRAGAKRLPEVKEGGFLGGHFDGYVVLYDLPTAKPLCGAPLRVRNSDEVRRSTRGVFRKSADQAVLTDFKQNFEKSAAEALKQLSPRINFEL